MPIKDILVHVDTTPACRARVWLAGKLGRQFDAYLIGVGTQAGGAAEERFAAVLSECAIQGEWRTVMGSIEPSITQLACAADLVILGQPDPDRLVVELSAPEDVLLGCGRPVLIVPYEGEFDHVGEKVLIAWNASREATQAAHDALPLMAAATAVSVLYVDPAWPLSDGCVTVPGYDVPILPASGVVQAAIYWTIASERGKPGP